MSSRPETTTHDTDPEDGRTVTFTWTTTTRFEYTASFPLAVVLENARRDAEVTDADGQVLLGELTTDNWALDMMLADHETEDATYSVEDVDRTIVGNPELTTG